MAFPSSRRIAAPQNTGHCFRTGADGRIPLTHDWLRLLREATRVGRFALQTRHASARLVTETTLAEISLRAEGARALAFDETGLLDFRFASWGQAWGYLRACECCASPGRLEVINRTGGEFLQLCAMPDAAPHGWSDYLAAITTPAGNLVAEPAAPGSPPLFTLPCMRGAHATLPFDLEALSALLYAFGDEGLPVRCTVRTADLSHQREFVPSDLVERGGIFTVGENGTRLQLAWPTVASVAVTHDASGWALHLLNHHAAIVLTLSAAHAPAAAVTWHNALQTAFPGLA